MIPHMGKPNLKKAIKKSDLDGLLAALTYEGEGVSPAFERFETRTGAAEALGNLGRAEAIEPLRQKLGDVTEQIIKFTEMAPNLIKAADEAVLEADKRENLKMMEVMLAALEMNRQSGVAYARALRKLGDQNSAATEQFLSAVGGFDENKASQSSSEIQQQ